MSDLYTAAQARAAKSATYSPSEIRQKLLVRGARRARRAEKGAENEAIRTALGYQDPKQAPAPPRIASLEAARAIPNRRSRVKKKRLKRPKLPSLKKLKKNLWDVMTEYVRQRDGSICRICQKNEGYALYHLVPASEGAASKWDAENCVWGCESCNCAENYHRARYARIHEQLFGREFMDRLWAKSRQTLQLRRPDLEAMIADLKSKLPQGEP